MQYYHHDAFETYFDNLTLTEIQNYMRSALTGLSKMHLKGIIHRDIKPTNILFDRKSQKCKIIDFNRAEVYMRGKPRSTKIGSKFFKAPEILVGYPHYDFGVDIWNLGLILGSFIFRKFPLFYFSSGKDLLDVVVQVFGFERLFKFLSNYSVTLADSRKKRYFGDIGAGFQLFVSKANQDNLHEPALDLLEKMLVIDPHDRITALQALEHPFLRI